MASTPLPGMADDSSTSKKLHIAMFPWLAFGHMMPFLQLAKLIAGKGHKISFISTPRNIDRLPKLPPDLTPYIDFVKLPLPKVSNLPETAEATTDLPYDKVQYLKIAYDNMQEPISKFLESSSPDWILYDFAPYWVAPIAAKLNISTCFYSIIIAACLGFVGPAPGLMYGDDRKTPEDWTIPPKWVTFPSNVAFRVYEVRRMFDSVTGNESDASDMYRFGASIDGCEVIGVRSCSEFEPEWLKVVEELHRKPVVPVGQLPPAAYNIAAHDHKDGVWAATKDWLDKQARHSVVYVAFGSEAKPTQDELTEIALGLELSGLPFFWVFRKQRGEFDTEVIELPDGFEERTKERGIVCTSWAPQLKILSHDSVGGFLTHSGWSSVVEAVEFERALILLTFLADQGLNARVLEEKKMAYSIPRHEEDGSFTRNAVAESLRLVMLEEDGKIYRDKVKEMRRLFGDRNKQDKYVDNLLSILQSRRQQTKQTKQN